MTAIDVDYRRLVLDAVADEGAFLRLTLSCPIQQRKEASPCEGRPSPAAADGAGAGESAVWEKVSVRPVVVGGRRVVQVAYSAGKRHITKNFDGAAVLAELAVLLSATVGFSQISVQSTTGDLHVRISRKGKALIRRGKPSRPEAAPVLEHNRAKAYALPAGGADDFLHRLGIAAADGKIKAAMSPKFRQINEFLRVIESVLGNDDAQTPGRGDAERRVDDGETRDDGSPFCAVDCCDKQTVRRSQQPTAQKGEPVKKTSRSPTSVSASPLHVVDCGCGNAYLTFAAFHYIRHVQGLPARVTGVDMNADLIANCRRLADSLGWADELEFCVSPIAEFAPAVRPNLVVSLHACDTATDDALAQAVRWQSDVILAAPCCQHELHDQLDEPSFAPLLRHGILRQRLGDLLTDTFRATALRIAGYRTRVFQFISPEHTAKNVLIEARRITGPDPGKSQAIAEYKRLRAMWNVQPAIERLLGIEGVVKPE